MNWEAVGAIGEVVGALAVVLTLAYLARQIRLSNRQDLLAAFRHNFDSTNQFLASTLESAELAEIVVKGRASYEALTAAERLRFDHFHFIVLNIVESNLFQVKQTAEKVEREYAEWARENMQVVVAGYFAFPGTRTLWSHLEPYYDPNVRDFVKDILEATPRLEAGGQDPAARAP